MKQTSLPCILSEIELATLEQLKTSTGKEANIKLIEMAVSHVKKWNAARIKAGLAVWD